MEKPFPIIRRFTTSYPHAGTLIERDPDANTLKKRLVEGDEAVKLADPLVDDTYFVMNPERKR